MLYIDTIAGNLPENVHVGQAIGTRASRINYVQASGDELEYIRHRYRNIPMVTSKVVRWYGDDAKFICANWA